MTLQDSNIISGKFKANLTESFDDLLWFHIIIINYIKETKDYDKEV